jgi:hypothetical protein
MSIGFVIRNANGSSTFGISSTRTLSHTETCKLVAEKAGVGADAVTVVSVEEVLSQYNGMAFLTPAES